MHEINTTATSSSPCASQGNNGQFRNRIKVSKVAQFFHAHLQFLLCPFGVIQGTLKQN